MSKSKKPADAWDVRTEPLRGALAVDMRSGTIAPTASETNTRVLFRKAGSRGRFSRFVVVGPMPRDLQALCTSYASLVAS